MIAATVDEAAERFGERAAFVSPTGWSLSYLDLARLSHEVAAAWIHRGIGEGDVVALVLPSVPEYAIAYVAAARIGAITAGVNARLTAAEREAVLTTAAPALVVSTASLAPEPGALPRADRLVVTPADTAAANDGDVLAATREPGNWVEPLPDDPDRPVAIVFTSGTTGTPKGAVFANRQLDFITLVDTAKRWGGGGPQLAGTSMAHLGPMTKLPGNLMRGATAHLMERWRAGDALALVAEHHMTGIGGIPTQIALMLREPDFDRYDLSSLQAIVMGGGPATPALVREARRRFGAAVAIRYSCTEAGVGVGTAFDAPPEDAEVSVGVAHEGITLSVIDADGRALAPGDVGEVCLRSPAVMTGYWHDPSATRAAFTTDGSVRTGDLGFVDEQGRLHLVGRRKELYVRGGYNVYPAEVEQVLAEHTDLADVAVVPRADDVMGEIGVAVVVARDGAPPPSLTELRDFAASRLAAHKLPEALVVLDALPLTAMDKVDRRALGSLVAEH